MNKHSYNTRLVSFFILAPSPRMNMNAEAAQRFSRLQTQ